MAAGPFGTPNRAPAPASVKGLWERAISMYRTTWSFVLEAKAYGRSVTWFGWDAPHGTAYLPLFGSATESGPDSYHSRDGHMSKFSIKVAFWAFNLVNQYQDLNFQLINADVRKRAHEIENEAVQAVALWEEEADKIKDQSAAMAHLTHRSNAFVNNAVEGWWTFAFSLITKFRGFVVTYNESANGEVRQTYPEWWLRSPEVGFTAWKRWGPFHGILLNDDMPMHAALLETLRHSPGAFSAWFMICACCCGVVLAGCLLLGRRIGCHRKEGNADTDKH